MVSLLQSAAFRISPVVIPASAAAEVHVLALRTEWALNVSVFNPALPSMDLSHLAIIVEEDIGLWGLFRLRNGVECEPLIGIVQDSYSLKVKIGHNLSSCGYNRGRRTPFCVSIF